MPSNDIIVHTQDELDVAIRDHGNKPVRIIVDSDPGITLRITESGRLADLIVGSASVVEVVGSARVDWVVDSARVGRVVDSASVGRVGGSASVDWVGDSARVDLIVDSASVVEVVGSARVDWVGDSARVERAAGMASLHLYDNATLVKAAPYVAVYLHSQAVTIDGGHVIDITAIDERDPATWCALVGVDIEDGHAITYKAVDEALRAGHAYTETTYALGETIVAADWKATSSCGHGLHTSPTPSQAREYFGDAARFLKCATPLAELMPLDSSKCKSRSVRVLAEVTIDAEPVAS